MSDKREERISGYKTARGALYVTIKNLVTGIAGALFFMFAARFLLSVSDIGLIHGLQLLIIIAVSLASLGLTNAAIRFISYHIGAGRLGLAKETSALIFTIGSISSFLVAVLVFVIGKYIAIVFFHEISYTSLVSLAGIDVFFFSMVIFSSYILYAMQEFKRVAIIMTGNSVLKFSSALGFIMLGLGIDGVVLGLILGDIVTLLIFVYLLRSQILSRLENFRSKISALRTLLDYSLPIFGSHMLNLLSVNIDYYLVLLLSGLYTAGIYTPAVLIGSLFLTITAGAGETLLPHFSRIYGRSGIQSLNEVSVFTSRYIFLVFFPLGFALLVCSSPLITLTFGTIYSDSVYPASIIILATTFTSIGIVFNFILMSAGYSRLFLTSTLLALIVQVVLSFVTIPSIGANGAALARALAYIIMFLYPAYKLKRIAGLHLDIPALRNGLAGSIIASSVTFALNHFLGAVGYLPISLLVGVFSYLLFLRYTGAMNYQDFEVMNNILANKMRTPIGFIERIVISKH